MFITHILRNFALTMKPDSEQARRHLLDPENSDMLMAWKLVSDTSQSVFLTGKAGTGKSTLLRYIMANTKKAHIVLAPTGIAAINVGGQTLHFFSPAIQAHNARRPGLRRTHSAQTHALSRRTDKTPQKPRAYNHR